MNFVITAGGSCAELPMDDPVVAAHMGADSSLVQCLLQQINLFRTYEPLFRGGRHLTLLDIGANMGLVSVYAHDVCDRVVAVEPAPQTFAVLERVAGRFQRISTLRAALNDKDGPCVFHVNDQNTTASSVVNTYGTEIEVVGMTLKSIIQGCSLDSVDVCKIDVEGSEEISLPLEQLEWAKPIVRAYWVETHNCPKTTGEWKMGQLVERFARLGYTRMKIDGTAICAQRPC